MATIALEGGGGTNSHQQKYSPTSMSKRFYSKMEVTFAGSKQLVPQIEGEVMRQHVESSFINKDVKTQMIQFTF